MAAESTENELAENSTPCERCPICLESFEDKVILSACFHAFCRFCITQWAEYEPAKRHGKNRCPLCRTEFQAMFHNFSADTQAYDVTHVDMDRSKLHWSQYQAEEAATKLQGSESKSAAITRRRRLLVYSQSLVPVIDFKLPKLPADKLSPSYVSLLRKVTLLFLSRGPQFIGRELPILLFHHTMIPGASSLHKQQTEVSLLTDLIMALVIPALPSLLSFLKLWSKSVGKDDARLLSSVLLEDASGTALFEALSGFLGDSAPLFLREFALFVLSPWTLTSFDLNVTYNDPNESDI